MYPLQEAFDLQKPLQTGYTVLVSTSQFVLHKQNIKTKLKYAQDQSLQVYNSHLKQIGIPSKTFTCSLILPSAHNILSNPAAKLVQHKAQIRY